MASNTIDLVLRVLGAEQARTAFRGTGEELKRMADEANKAVRDTERLGRDTSGLQRIADQAQEAADAFNRSAISAEAFSNRMERMRNTGAALTLVGGGMAVLGGKALMAADSIDRIKIGLTTMLGSADKAEEMLKGIQQFDADSPFDFAQSAAGAQKLLAMGVEAGDVLQTMRSIGNAISAAGGGQEEFNGILLALGQMKTKGKVSQEELNQMAERGIPALRILARELNLTAEQVANIGTQGIEASKAIPALLKGFEKDFGGAMDKASNTLSGKLSTLDSAVGKLEASLGSRLVPTVSLAADAMTGAADAVAALPGPVQATVAGIYGVSTVALTAGGSVMTLVGQVGMANMGLQAMGITGVRAFFTMKLEAVQAALAANSVTAASLGLKLAIAGVAVAASVALAGIIYKLAQMAGLIDKNSSLMEDMAMGWDVITGNTQEAEAKRGRKKREEDLQAMNKAAADMRTSGKSEEEIEKFVQARTAEIETHYAAQFKAHGDTDDYIKSSEALGALRKSSAVAAAVSAVPAATVSPSVSMADTAPLVDMGPDDIQTSIDQISAQITATSDKGAKQALTARKAGLQRAKQAADKMAREGKRKAGLSAKGDMAEQAALYQNQIDELRDGLDERRDVAKDQLEDKIDGIKRQMAMHAISKTAGQSMIDSLQEKHQHMMEAWAQESDAKEKALEAQRIMAEAGAQAAAQDAETAAATMRVARAKADRAMRASSRAMGRMERELRRSEQVEASTGEAANPFARFARRTAALVSSGGGMFNPYAGRSATVTAIPSVSQNPDGSMTVKFADIKLPRTGVDGALAGI